jgi:ABC-type multidrug transport system permease subunit
MRRWLRAFRGIARRDLLLLASYRSSYVSRPLGAVFMLALFYYVSRLLEVSRFASADAYFSFVAVGIVIFGLVTSSLLAPARVREDLIAGTYERMELSAMGGTAAVLATVVAPLVYAVVLSLFTLAVACTLFGMDLQWSTAPLAVPVGLLGALAFAPFALFFCALTLAFKQAPGQGALLPALSLVSGLYFPVDLLPGWLRWLSDVQPLTPTVDAMRALLLGADAPQSTAVLSLRIAAFALAGLPIALVSLNAARALGRSRGTLLES